MTSSSIYQDISERTGGAIYIGITGPCRTGKSTFIRRFMEKSVLPNMTNTFEKERARDELPLIGQGKIITTTEPKFVPSRPADLQLGNNIKFKMRLIDCVGYVVDGAEGITDGEEPRMVNTPWSDKQMPLETAARLGTNKVINDHSTVAIVMTTDGSITDIPRENYIQAEEDIIAEVKKSQKPFILVLNSAVPYSPETDVLRAKLEDKYEVPVLTVNCSQLRDDDINEILEGLLYEFPVNEININIPRWLAGLDNDHWLKKSMVDTLLMLTEKAGNLRGIPDCASELEANEFIRKAYVGDISAGNGDAEIDVAMNDDLFYKVLSETIAMDIKGDYELISIMKELSNIRNEYNKVSSALSDVRRKGYGIVGPTFEDIVLNEPEPFKHGSRYGIKIKARGEAINMIKTDIETEVSPIVGTEEQSKEFIDNILSTYKTDKQKIWELNLFGRTLDTLVKEGMHNKIYTMSEDAQMKLQESLQKIINEGSGGLICIIL
ncbi:MAG: stage IV sporulation protein A [Candidatus Metalachnospira sp.]|nr:stage IV sporulation protein A [Candidatus Metalachnospira sp.]